MIWVESELFENQDVKLDFTRWRNCTFKKCVIIIAHGEFDLVGCNFDDCRLSVVGNAATVIQVAKMFFPEIPVIETSKPKP